MRTIIFKGDPIHKEGDALASVKPGHLVELDSAGKVKKVGTAGKNTAVRVVRERDWIGEDTEATIPAGERVEYIVPRAGDEVYLRVPAAAAAIVIGDSLQANADGTASKVSTGTPLAMALSAVDNSAGASEAWVLAEIF
jgi:hypothetical protein